MHSSVESLLALTCVWLALGLVACDSHVCEGDELPHPRGLCGRRLAQAHSNLCFLLREVYHREHYHRDKRSPRLEARADGLVKKIYSIPLDVLAELDLSKDDWHQLFVKKSATDFELSPAAPLEGGRKRLHHGMNAFTRRVLRLLRGEADPVGNAIALAPAETRGQHPHDRNKRTVISNMVCDCCYNRCSPEELGTYC